MMALMAGMGVVGYMYLKMNPKAMNKMKEMTNDAKDMINDMRGE